MGILDLIRKIRQVLKAKNGSKRLSKQAKIVIGVAALILCKLYLRAKPSEIQPLSLTLTLTEFLNPMNLRTLQNIKIGPSTVEAIDVFRNKIKAIYHGNAEKMYDEIQSRVSANVSFERFGPVNKKLDFLIFLLPFLSGLFIYFFFSLRQQTAKKSSKPLRSVRFDDIIGLDSAKFALREVMDYLINPEKYEDRGARMRRGILLYGPPGTGKTTLAKACANQAGIPFYSCNAAQFCEIYIGMGPKKIRDLFEKARQSSPSVIFIDQLDAFGSRSNENSFVMESANSEKNSTINQILSQLDGFESSDRVLVIAATNRLQMVDKSLVRSGRFDLKIQISLPTNEGRIKMVEKYLGKTKHSVSNEFIKSLIQKSQYCSGADIEAMVNQAIYLSMRRNSKIVEEEDIIKAIQEQSK